MASNLQEGRDVALNVSSVTFRDGRMFYSVGSTLYFSKIEEAPIDRVKCFQINDPTDFEIPDILATDGGTIDIKGIGGILNIAAFRQGLLAVSSEGCWYITGGPDITASAYSASRITNYGMDFSGSFVVAGNIALYMNKGGIVALQANEFDTVDGAIITDTTIKSYIEANFTNDDDNRITATYDSKINEIHWLNADSLDLLIFDLETRGYYPQKLQNPDGQEIQRVVSDEGEDMYDYVAVEVTGEDTGAVTWYELDDDTYLDFGTEDYEAYLETGPESLGSFALKKNVTSIAIAFSRTETAITGFDTDYVYDYPSGCLLSQRADLSTYAGYQSVPRQAYRINRRRWMTDSVDYPVPLTDQGDNIVYFEDTVRGSSRVTSFRFEAEAGKDMQLIGFSVDFSMKGRQR